MRAIEFDECNLKIAEHQPEYETLPVFHNAEEGSIVYCFELDEEEIKQVRETGQIYIKQLTFNKPMQPIGMTCLKEVNLKPPKK